MRHIESAHFYSLYTGSLYPSYHGGIYTSSLSIIDIRWPFPVPNSKYHHRVMNLNYTARNPFTLFDASILTLRGTPRRDSQEFESFMPGVVGTDTAHRETVSMSFKECHR